MSALAEQMSEAARLTALTGGEAGAAWLANLDALVAGLAADWGLSVGAVMPGGTEALVVDAAMADGRPAVLKVCMPGRAGARNELRVLLAGQGCGYARVYRHDWERGAFLLERLGPQLHALDLPVAQQIGAICATLKRTWACPSPDGPALPTAIDKADALISCIERSAQMADPPCAAATVERCRAYAERRRRAFDPASAVLAHGDAHAWNTLVVPGAEPLACRLIDPDGFIAERAYDLSISMREWNEDLMAGDPIERGTTRCRLLASLAGVEPQPIWEWGLLERIANGLIWIETGLPELGRPFIAIGEAWARAEPVW